MWKRANNNSCARCDLAFDREASEPLRRLVERPRRRSSPAAAPAASGSAASPAAPAAVTAGQKRKLEPQQSVSESASDLCSPTKQSVLSELDLKPALPHQTPVKRESTGAMPVAAAAAVAHEEQRPRAQPAADGDQLRSRTTLLGPPLPAASQPNGLQRSAGSAFEAVAAHINNNSNPQQDFFQQLIASASRATALANANPPQAQPQLPQLPFPPPQQQQQQNLPFLMQQLFQRFGAAGQPGAAAGAVLLNGPKPPLPPAAQHPFLSLQGLGLPAGFPGLPPNPLHNLPMSMALQFPGFPAPGLAGVPGFRPPPSLPGLPFTLDPGAALIHSLLSGGPPSLPNPMTNPFAAAVQLQMLNALSQSPLASPLHQSLGFGGQVGPANGLNNLNGLNNPNNLGALSNLLLGQLAAAMAGSPPVQLAAQLPPPPQPQQRPSQALPPGAFLHSSTSTFTNPNARLSNSSPQLPGAPLLSAHASHSQSQHQSTAAANASSTQSAFEAALVQNIMQTLSKSSLAPPPTASNALVGLKFPPEILDSLK